MQLNYKKLGESGSTIIILHGLLGSLDNWQTIAKQLAEKHQVFIVDQRNHGRSPHTDEMNYEVLANDASMNFVYSKRSAKQRLSVIPWVEK
jgi:esterase